MPKSSLKNKCIFTICSKNYLAQALTLKESIKKHEPSVDFYIFLADLPCDDIKNIDLICITHLHGDHFYGLMGLLSTIGNSSRIDDLTIVGPKGIGKMINALKTLIEYLPYKIIVVYSCMLSLK